MNEVSFFLKQGWNNIWNMRTVWLFSALPLVSDFFSVFVNRQDETLSGAWNSLAGSLIFLILLMVNAIGLPYSVYRFSTGRPAAVSETFAAVQKFAGRALGCGCIVLLILLPGLYLALVFSRSTSLQPFQSSIQLLFVLLFFSLFGALVEFPLFEFFAKDVGIRQSLRESWRLFTAHVYPLVALGFILTLASRIISAAAGLLTVVIQSGFDAEVLRTLNYLNPWVSMAGNLLFTFLHGIGQMINSTWSVSAFALAYLKYRGVEPTS